MKNKYNLKNKTISEIANWVHDHIKGDRPERIAIEQWANIVGQHFYRAGYDAALQEQHNVSINSKYL